MPTSTDVLLDLLRPERLTAVVDVGANPIDGDPPYASMLQQRLCTVVGFEPQPTALAELERRRSDLETYLPYVIADGRPHILHMTASSGMTSLLEPDPVQLALFNGFTEWGAVTHRETVATKRLDDVEEIGHLDVLKIDVQGGELMVFRGGTARLSAAVAVQTEVSFIPLYKGQPSFGDIDVELRRHGLVPHAVPAVKRWAIAPVVYGGNFRQGGNQVLEADVVYVRDFAHPELMDDEQLKHLALVAHCAYGSSDLAHRCLLALVERGAGVATGPASYLASTDT